LRSASRASKRWARIARNTPSAAAFPGDHDQKKPLATTLRRRERSLPHAFMKLVGGPHAYKSAEGDIFLMSPLWPQLDAVCPRGITRVANGSSLAGLHVHFMILCK
jgi:hypothetical protein